jgi:ribA/ribD-fused uncharacterized protein
MNETIIPDYAINNETTISGFFGPNRWLSNFYPAPCYYNGLYYPSVENAYQAQKCWDDDNKIQFTEVNAGQSKKLGRKVTKREDWEEIKYQVMAQCLVSKFMRWPLLRKQLLETGDKYLEEANHWGDRDWGVCDGEGENNLGKLLMATREFIRQIK